MPIGIGTIWHARSVLQVVTKKYFREGVPLHTTEHRQVLYTNRSVVTSEVIELPIGSLQASASFSASPFVFTMTVVEHLEAEDPDGTRSTLVATSGDALIDDLAAVLSFWTNSIFTRDIDVARRLVGSANERKRGSAGALFRETFDADRFLSDTEIDGLRGFMTNLVDLRRGVFEAVMRAIRRIVRATQRADVDPTLAYVDMVAALESLAPLPDETPSWERLDGRKRKLIDGALGDAPADISSRVREAILRAERAGARWRFTHFVQDHVGPEYFRDLALGQVRPIRDPDFSKALNRSYEFRSRSVHSLDELPAHLTLLNDQADTGWAPGYGVMLSLQGLTRLARHVIANLVDRSPRDVDETFDWRSAIPGRLEMTLAPQYWLWQDSEFSRGSAEDYFAGFADHVLGLWAGEGEGVPPMQDVLRKIEALTAGTQPGPAKTAMVGLYAAWHAVVHPDSHLPNAQSFISAHRQELAEPSMVAFVTGLLCNELPGWTDDQWCEFGQKRWNDRTRGHLPLAAGFDAALHSVISERLHLSEQPDGALRFADLAIRELPGEQRLLDWETALRNGTAQELDIRRVLTGTADENAEHGSPDENGKDGEDLEQGNGTHETESG